MGILYYNINPELRYHIRMNEALPPEEIIQRVQEIEDTTP